MICTYWPHPKDFSVYQLFILILLKIHKITELLGDGGSTPNTCKRMVHIFKLLLNQPLHSINKILSETKKRIL